MSNIATRGWARTRSFLPQAATLFALQRPLRDLMGLGPSLGRAGSLEVRLATTKKDIRRAQKLRYKVFYEEGGAIADARSAITGRDICAFDRISDHLVVLDHDCANRFGQHKPKVVGCYRLLRQDMAARYGGFYSANEFDIGPLLARHPDKRFLELGRSCVHRDWRGKRVLELLWRGLWTYVRHHRIDVMIGCASLPGVDARDHAASLAFLHQQALGDGEWRVRPLPGRVLAMDQVAPEGVNARRVLGGLPPLVKGYLRVGAKFGEGAVVDRQFGTTDVFVMMPVAQIDPRYITYFGAPEDQRLTA